MNSAVLALAMRDGRLELGPVEGRGVRRLLAVDLPAKRWSARLKAIPGSLVISWKDGLEVNAVRIVDDELTPRVLPPLPNITHPNIEAFRPHRDGSVTYCGTWLESWLGGQPLFRLDPGQADWKELAFPPGFECWDIELARDRTMFAVGCERKGEGAEAVRKQAMMLLDVDGDHLKPVGDVYRPPEKLDMVSRLLLRSPADTLNRIHTIRPPWIVSEDAGTLESDTEVVRVLDSGPGGLLRLKGDGVAAARNDDAGQIALVTRRGRLYVYSGARWRSSDLSGSIRAGLKVRDAKNQVRVRDAFWIPDGLIVLVDIRKLGSYEVARQFVVHVAGRQVSTLGAVEAPVEIQGIAAWAGAARGNDCGPAASQSPS